MTMFEGTEIVNFILLIALLIVTAIRGEILDELLDQNVGSFDHSGWIAY